MSSLPCKHSGLPTFYHDGYGRVSHQGKLVGAHRVAYATAHNISLEEMEGKVVMHTCDNRWCIEPTHLKLATQQENVQDMWSKGRQGVKGMPGSSHPLAKLTEEIVKEIKSNKTDKGKTLAIRYSVSVATVSMIRSGKIWKHVIAD